MKKERLCTVPTVTPEGPLGSQSSESIVEFVDLHRVAGILDEVECAPPYIKILQQQIHGD